MRATSIRSVILVSAVLTGLSAQQAITTIPRVVRMASSFVPTDGGKPAPTEGVTLSIYREERGGVPLWQETQNVSVDSEGRYSVLLGATVNEGLPLDLFSSGEPRWVGVRFNRPGEAEQARTLLASVPYALRASDAETLGGLPASAFLRDPSASSSSPASAAAATANLIRNAPKPRVTSGTPGYIGVFTDATDLGNSIMYQNGYRIGVNTPVPADFLHVAFVDNTGVTTGIAVQNFGNGANAYSGMLFYDQNGNLGQFQGFNNSTHEYRINNIASGGTINFMIGGNSKFQVLNSGDINVNGNLQYAGNVALQLGQFASHNVGLGYGTLSANTGSNNTATGYNALLSNTSASANTAFGAFAMDSNTTGFDNTATGYQALFANTTGGSDTAVGVNALVSNTTGSDNTGVGYTALTYNITGGQNTAVGFQALLNSIGNNNIALGANAGESLNGGNSNIYIGADIPSAPTPGAESNTIRIGYTGQTRTFIGAISGTTTGLSSGAQVVVDTNGQLGTVLSSIRYKEDVQDMGDASDGLLKLRPVTYRYKQAYADGSKPLDYGLIAEEVNEIYPDLVVKDREGQVQTVQYQKLVPMLLNELQKLQGRVAALEELLSSRTPPDADGHGHPEP